MPPDSIRKLYSNALQAASDIFARSEQMSGAYELGGTYGPCI